MNLWKGAGIGLIIVRRVAARTGESDGSRGRSGVVKTPVSSMLLVILASVIGSFAAVFLKWVGQAEGRIRHLISWRLAPGSGCFWRRAFRF